MTKQVDIAVHLEPEADALQDREFSSDGEQLTPDTNKPADTSHKN